MEHAFVVRLAAPDADAAARLVALVESGLTARGARILHEGDPHPRAGSTFRILAAPRAEPGSAALVGVGADQHAPAWLPPIQLSAHPENAALETLAFLERWGFIATRPAA